MQIEANKTAMQSDCIKQTNNACVKCLQLQIWLELGCHMLGYGPVNLTCVQDNHAQLSQVKGSATTESARL